MLIRWIKGYEGLYAATDEGAIVSYHSGEPKYMSLALNDKLRKTVVLYKDGKPKTFKVHRLIALTFIPNPENKPQVNHIDGRPYVNRVSNLEWSTDSENKKHAFAMGLKDNRGKKHPSFDHTIYTFNHPVFGTVQCTRSELIKIYQATNSGISLLIKGKIKHSSGWVLVND